MYARVARHLAAVGLNVVGVADGTGYQHVLPGCGSVLVVGSGGPDMWEHFVAHVRRSPEWALRTHPLDDWVAAQLPVLPGARWLRCAANETLHIDFRRLAVEAGLGWVSATQLIIHPKHGLWLGLRAALFSTLPVQGSGRLVSDSPCVGCDRPCEAACPVAAIGGGRWDHTACLAQQQRDPRGCGRSCAVRRACPVGTDSAYPEAAERYHHAPGRDRLFEACGVGGSDGVS